MIYYFIFGGLFVAFLVLAFELVSGAIEKKDK